MHSSTSDASRLGKLRMDCGQSRHTTIQPPPTSINSCKRPYGTLAVYSTICTPARESAFKSENCGRSFAGTPLFNPRRHKWTHHFRYDGGELIGRTAIGRTTVEVLRINQPNLIALRELLMYDGLF